MSEIPVHSRPRRLAEWINPTGARKVHSLVDKVYQRKNLEIAWEKVKANRGSGGVDVYSLPLEDIEAVGPLASLPKLINRIIIGPTSLFPFFPVALYQAFEQLLSDASVADERNKIRASEIPLRQ
jgi:hypothetical protein